MIDQHFWPPPAAVRSLRHWIADTLREAIITGRLEPGDRLRELDLSQQMKVSRGPVREALRQLEQEGLIVSFPHRGTEVVGVSAEEVRHVLIPIRLTLERFAFRHALPILAEDDFVILERLVHEMREAGLRNGIVVYPGTGMADGARGDIISLYPPLTISEGELGELGERLRATFDEVAPTLSR